MSDHLMRMRLADDVLQKARALVKTHIPNTSTFAYPAAIALLSAVELYEASIEQETEP